MQSFNDIITAGPSGPDIASPEFVAALVAEYGAQHATGIAARVPLFAAEREQLDDAALRGLAMVASLCLHLMGDGPASVGPVSRPNAGSTVH